MYKLEVEEEFVENSAELVFQRVKLESGEITNRK